MNQELKARIVSSYEESTPDVLARVKSAIDDAEQYDIVTGVKPSRFTKYRRMSAMAAMLVFVCGLSFLLGRGASTTQIASQPENIEIGENVDVITMEAPKKLATVYLDMGPSLQLEVNEALRVTSVNADNSSAKPVVDELELMDVSYETAIKSIVGQLYLSGQINVDTKAILISIDAETEADYQETAEGIKKLFDEEATAFALVLQPVKTQAKKTEAQAYKTTVGKLEFVDRIIDSSLDYTEDSAETLLGFTIDELYNIFNGIYEAAPVEPGKENAPKKVEEIEIVPAKTSGLVTELIEDTADLATDTIDEAGDLATKTVEEAADTTNDAIETITDVANDTVDNVADTINRFIKNIFN